MALLRYLQLVFQGLKFVRLALTEFAAFLFHPVLHPDFWKTRPCSPAAVSLPSLPCLQPFRL